MSEDSALKAAPSRPRLAVLFVVLALATTALFVPTFQAYVATDGVNEAGTTVTDAAVGPNRETLRIDLLFENPTAAAVTVTSGQIRARDGEGAVTRIAGTNVNRTTVPAGEAVTLRIEIAIIPDHRDRATAALAEDRLWVGGFLWVAVGEERVKVRVNRQKVSADGT